MAPPVDCRALREQRDGLASQAIAQEIALLRTFRVRICPRLDQQAEGANARDLRFEPIDYRAWNRCRTQAERQLERSLRVRYRNQHGFTFYSPEGAALAERADAILGELKAGGCP